MTDNYRDNYYGSILDPLHGDIKLSEIEKWIISQPIFSRLKRVKQNTFLYYVFPSAIHTRFEHSIGVMHLAGKIFDSCKENYATGQKKKEKYSIKGESSFFDLSKMGHNEVIYFQELRLAALLHDVGHGPLSHLFDEFAISKERFLQFVIDSEILRPYKSGFSKLIRKNKDKVEHEIISCAFIFILIHNLKKTAKIAPEKFSKYTLKVIGLIRADRIVRLVEPEFADLASYVSKGIDYTLFLSRIISSFPIDSDRMDYLLRDSYFSGVTYGIYDINRIFASFLATVRRGKVHLTFKESGLDSMLRFIQSRSHLYNQVYFHKTNRAANSMLTSCTKSIRERKVKLLNSCENIDELISFYVKNSDEVFLFETIRTQIDEADAPAERTIYTDLINRRLFKRVFQCKIVLLPKEFDRKRKIDALKDTIDNKLRRLSASGKVYVVADSHQNITFKDAHDKNVLLAQKKWPTGYMFVKDWKLAGKEFQLSDMNVSVIRIFLQRTFKSSKEFEAMKKLVLRSVQDELEKLEKYCN